MKLENQVCSLEQAKRLKELGIRQDNEFYWVFDKHVCGEQTKVTYRWDIGFEDEDFRPNWSAFTVAELGVMLPTHIDEDKVAINMVDYEEGIRLEMEHQPGQWYYCYAGFKVTFAETEAQSRAALLIHLLESGKITASDCNQRLTL